MLELKVFENAVFGKVRVIYDRKWTQFGRDFILELFNDKN